MVNLIVRLLFSAVYLLLVLRALAPLADRNRSAGWLQPVYAATDWLLNPVRAGLPPEKLGMDVSPYVVIILLFLVQKVFF